MEDLAGKYGYLKNKMLGVRAITYIQVLLMLSILTVVIYDTNIYITPNLSLLINIVSSIFLFVASIVLVVRAFAKKEKEYFVSAFILFIASGIVGSITLLSSPVSAEFGIDLSNQIPEWLKLYPSYLLFFSIFVVSVYDKTKTEKGHTSTIRLPNLIGTVIAILMATALNYFAETYFAKYFAGFITTPLPLPAIILALAAVVTLIWYLTQHRWRYQHDSHMFIITLLFIAFQGIMLALSGFSHTDIRTLIGDIYFLLAVISITIGQLLMIYDTIHKGEIQRELAVRQSHRLEMFNRATDNVSEIIVISDIDGMPLYANPAVSKITGYSYSEAMNYKAGTLWGKQMPEDFYVKMWDTIKNKKIPFQSELRNKRKNGLPYYASINISPVTDSTGNLLYFVAVERDITEEKLNEKRKYDFLSVISHRLRTPLTTSKWSLEMLNSGEAGRITKEQKEIFKDLNDANERLIELVNIMVRITDLEAGKVLVTLEEIKPVDWVKGIVKKYDTEIKRKKLNIHLAKGVKLPTIKHDRDVATSIVSHVIENAIKFSPNKGNIDISIKFKDHYVVIEVKDEGPGIPEADKRLVFKTFYRGNNIVNRDVNGTGMGLYMAKLLMDTAEGKIWFDSEVGKGSTFWMAFPLIGKSQVHEALDVLNQNDEEVTHQKPKMTTVEKVVDEKAKVAMSLDTKITSIKENSKKSKAKANVKRKSKIQVKSNIKKVKSHKKKSTAKLKKPVTKKSKSVKMH